MSKLNSDKVGKTYIAAPVAYSRLGTYINDANDKMIADVRGWGWIQKLAYAEDIQDGIGQFIADAINEKLERSKTNDQL